MKAEPPKNLFPKTDLLKADPSRKAETPDPGNKISQKKKKFAEKTDSALETNGVLYQKVYFTQIYIKTLNQTIKTCLQKSNETFGGY